MWCKNKCMQTNESNETNVSMRTMNLRRQTKKKKNEKQINKWNKKNVNLCKHCIATHKRVNSVNSLFYKREDA